MKFPVADGHCDFLYGVVNNGYDFSGEPARHQNITLNSLTRGNVRLQLFAAWTDTSLRIPACMQFLEMADAYHTMLVEEERLKPFSQSSNPEEDSTFTVLTMEGGEALEGSLANLRMFHRLGLRALGLTWNENNELSGAAAARGNRGLTSLGREVIREMGRLGIALDVAHLSDRGIAEALEIAEAPIFSSHTNCRAVFDHARSLPDDLIRKIAAQGGTIGINFYNKQLTRSRDACIEDIVRQFLHLADVGGIAVCAIGSDFDGMPHYPRDLKDSGDFPALAEALLQAGFSQNDVERIMFQNLWNYMRQFV